MVKLLVIISEGLTKVKKKFENLIRLKLLFYTTDCSLEYSSSWSVSFKPRATHLLFPPPLFLFSAASELLYNVLYILFVCRLVPLSPCACVLLEAWTNVSFQECLCVSLAPDGLRGTWVCISVAVSKFWVVHLSFRSNTASPKRSTNSPRASARGGRDRFAGESYTVLGELNLLALWGKGRSGKN